MKRFFIIVSLFLITLPLLSTQLFVVGEVFTQTWCGFCPAARSALRQMYEDEDNYSYLIPIIWQGDGPFPSPQYGSRASLYSVGGIPHAQFGGTNSVVGGGTGVINNYINAYNQLVNLPSPIIMESSLNMAANNQLEVSVDIELINSITTTNNKLIFLLTYNLDAFQTGNYFASVTAYHQQDFDLTQPGETGVYSHQFDLNPDFNLSDYKAIVLVQTFSGNKKIHQASKTGFTGLMPLFSSNVQTGPGKLGVQFNNFSLPEGGVVSWEWDLTGDGEIDSYEENPYFLYDTLGSYDITLTVSDGYDTMTVVRENYITVTDGSNVMGSLSGIWTEEYSPYLITGDVDIPSANNLIVKPGVQIYFNEATELVVRGLMKAEGAIDNPIVFTSEDYWRGIRFVNSLYDNNINFSYISKTNRTAINMDSSNLSLTNSKIYNNHITVNQPAALLINSSLDVIIRNNLIANNSSTGGSGALDANGSSIVLENNIVVNNTGSFAAAISVKANSEINITNNTIVNNEYTLQTGCHIFGHNSIAFVRNTILRGDGTIFNSFMGGFAMVNYSNISSLNFDGIGNIDQNPLFVESSEGAGSDFDGFSANWFLQEGSPCIDAGDPSPNYNDVEDPANQGYALFPAMGTLRNDMGAFGGGNSEYWTETDSQTIEIEFNDFIRIYPNPFNPDLNIDLQIPDKFMNQPISLKVYNLKGQLIKSILENESNYPKYINWNGRDYNNNRVTSGVYFISLEIDGFSTVKRALLIK